MHEGAKLFFTGKRPEQISDISPVHDNSLRPTSVLPHTMSKRAVKLGS
jgi:hypothetical protein